MTTDIYPSMRYRDALAAIEWLERAFGFERHVVYEGAEGAVDHAELRYGDGLVMLGSAREGDEHRKPGQGWAYVVVEDLHAHHDQAKAAGAEIVSGPQVESYGSFYGARDLEGNLWSFGTYRPSRPGAEAEPPEAGGSIRSRRELPPDSGGHPRLRPEH